MMKLLITIPRGELRDSFIQAETVELLKKHFEVTLNEWDRNYNEEELYEASRDFDVLVTGWGTASLSRAGLMKKGTRLKLLVHTGGTVGDLIDRETYENGIKVISGNKLYAESTAEGALAYIMSALRYIPDDVNKMKDGSYWSSPYLTSGLFDRTVGIIGVGAVSKNLMTFMKPFRVKLKVYDTYAVDPDFLASVGAEQTSLEDVLSTCSVVSLHMALNGKTRGMIGREQLSLLRDGTLFVNTSRGPIVDESALVDELATGRIRAILDVFTKEPLAADSPLRSMDNVYLIPHKAGPTYDMRSLIGYKLAEDAVRYLRGEELTYEIKEEAAFRMTKHD